MRPDKRWLINLAALFLLGCLPGPWDYTPGDKPVFRGIHLWSYAVADRPAENICMERLLDLKEARTDAFPFYDTADLAIEGPFSSGGQTLKLKPLVNTPNCFYGDTSVHFVRGMTYHFLGRIVWDSAGSRVVTQIKADAHIPKSFVIADTAVMPAIGINGLAFTGSNIFSQENFAKLPPNTRAQLTLEYGDTLAKLSSDTVALNAYFAKNGKAIFARLQVLVQAEHAFYQRGDSVYYIGGGSDLNNLSHYFHSIRSSDVAGVLINQRYDTLAMRPITSFDSILIRFGQKLDSGKFYYPGDLRRLIYYPSTRSASGYNVLDSMGIVNAWFWTGKNQFYFYGVEKTYSDFLSTTVEDAADNPKVRPFTNVQGGRGYFAGMVVDSFHVILKLDSTTKAYPYDVARSYACRDQGWFASRDCSSYYREFCRKHGWKREDCQLDAIYTCTDSLGRRDAPQGLCDSADQYKVNQPALALESIRRYCIDHNYPTEVAECSTVKKECETGSLKNDCQRVLWKSCELAYWKPAACVEGRKSFCQEYRTTHIVLCRNVPTYPSLEPWKNERTK